jgi:predicted metal-dependent hydrolase
MHKNQNIVEYYGIGAVTYVKNRHARNFSIRINSSGEVRVTIPAFASRKLAEQFLLSKKDWVLSRLSTLKKEEAGAHRVQMGETILVRGTPVRIELRNREQEAEEALWRLLLKEARSYLPGRVIALSSLHGYGYSGLKIRKMTSRWGSCTHKKGINLNSWLMMLPDHLIDYVILHELVHTRYPHHGPEFWTELDRVTGGVSKTLRMELRKRKILSIYPENQFSGQRNGPVCPR